MAINPRVSTAAEREVDYPTSDGKPMGETDLHRNDMMDVIQVLEGHFAAEPNVYVTGNLLLFYERGNRRRHVSPDAFVVRGVPKLPPRENYLVWQEGKGPDVVIEITSRTTRREDQQKKRLIYRDVLKVPEYFQFDPTEDYLRPPMQGHRLVEGEYVPIAPVEGRLPSKELGLHLERQGTQLRFYDPATGRRLPTRSEAAAESDLARQEAEAGRQEAEAGRQEAEVGRQEAEAALQQEAETRRRLEAENERLRRELEALRRGLPEGRGPQT
jgi:Uma2 family endonuclease